RGEVLDSAFATIQRWGIRLIGLAASILIIGWVYGHIWMILLPVALALIICTVLAPPVTWMRHHHLPGGVASALLLVLFIGLVDGVFATLVPQVAGQAGEIADGAAGGLQKVREWLSDGPLGITHGQITNAISALQEQLKSSAGDIGAGVFSTIGTATSLLF